MCFLPVKRRCCDEVCTMHSMKKAGQHHCCPALKLYVYGPINSCTSSPSPVTLIVITSAVPNSSISVSGAVYSILFIMFTPVLKLAHMLLRLYYICRELLPRSAVFHHWNRRLIHCSNRSWGCKSQSRSHRLLKILR